MLIVLIAAGLAVVLLVIDLRSSWAGSRLFARMDRRMTFRMASGPAPELERFADGPYDERLGLSSLDGFIQRLENRGYEISAQARDSALAIALTRIGLFPTYHEKSQAGLIIADRAGKPIFERRYPERVYRDFYSIPPLVVNTIVFIENRDLGDRLHPHRNPAIQWGRLARAVLDLGVHALDRSHPLIGGSTLATQLEKERHSPGGRTSSLVEKVRQVGSASLRAYQDGTNTLAARRRIICDYINSIPLAASPAEGEVIGLGDGLHAWYGAGFNAVNRILSANEATLNAARMTQRARAYREVLSLFLALRAPAKYLVHDPGALAIQTDRYLPMLAANGVISRRLRDAALRARITARPQPVIRQPASFVDNKASNAIRVALLRQLGIDSTYALDRLDLTVDTTLDSTAQTAATHFLESLSNPANVAAAGLRQYQLLDRGDPGAVIYSVTMYERGHGANLLRIQTDNYNQPLDINQGTKLQLGSTAKLRTLIEYLEIISRLHERYGNLSPADLKAVRVLPGDNLTHWALSYLSSARDKALEPMLEAAMARKYSGNPGEAFFTAGGLHHFVNFERSEDGEVMTVSEGFQRSVNLVFIRLLRDIERYYMFRVPGASPTVLADPGDPARRRYLIRFAGMEGSVFLKRFYEQYRNQTPGQALEMVMTSVRPTLTPLRAAVIYRSIRPRAGFNEFSAFMASHLPAAALARDRNSLQDLFEKYGPGKFDLNDRGYLARVHPLELWMFAYRERHPHAGLEEIRAASANERQQVYKWLFKTRYKHAQDKRIETLLEIDAFKMIHRDWKRLGYPFDSLVPSYATAIGVSGDTPAALAQLAGIIMNDGTRYPSVLIRQLHFAQDTPGETILSRRRAAPVRLLSPAIARLVRSEMLGVVQNGTGRRIASGIKLPNGAVLAVGGKTGTGDNRFEEFGTHGRLLGSRVVNRTAAFVFFIGDRYFGTVLAFVPGDAAGRYGFTSGLAVQVLKDIGPSLMPVLERASPEGRRGAGPRPAAAS